MSRASTHEIVHRLVRDAVEAEGRISATRKLKTAHYSVLVTAKSAAGKTSPAQSRSFTIAS
jgi:hypothetical protein